MSSQKDPSRALSADRQALVAIRNLRARVDELERARSEPIAIVGIGCRFPGGACNPDAYWRLLSDQVDAITEVPRDRWDVDAYYDPDPETPGKMNTRWGGFIEAVDRFDPQFFRIAPREAASIDPQHRLVLEVSWEALEHAGQDPEGLVGEPVGVFLGLSTADYAALQLQRGDPSGVDTYFGIGNAANAAAGRVSYVLGLQGPSLAVDTACSSSLVAVHLACQSLRSRECRMALAGGVNVILMPEVTINFSRARMMAPNGRCKTFDADADGYVRGEGCGIVVLKRLSDALADRDRLLALVRGSAVNQDGRSGGFTAPNELAQRAVIRQALEAAGVQPSDIDYLEAHGTGTPLGDPIEVQAAAAVLGHGRPADRRLKIGSVKTSIGHLEAAAGIAGLIKIALALEHGEIPGQLHFKRPNPYIAWSELPIDVADRRQDWKPGPRRRIAGVSSFGFSGTNAHVILEEAPRSAAAPRSLDRPCHILPLSARSEPALRALAERYVERLAGADPASIADICHTAGAGRAHFAHRLAAVAVGVEDLRRRLQRYLCGEGSVVVGRTRSRKADPGPVFLFTGQGAQYPGMARQLFETSALFRAALERCDAVLQGRLEQSLVSMMYPRGGDAASLSNPGVALPALFALEYALAELWREWGVRPGAVLGHGIGEVAAACVAGVLTVEHALTVVTARARLMQEHPRGGPAGSMDPLLDAFEHDVNGIAPRPAEAPIVSNVTGEIAPPDFRFDAAYWRRQAREPIMFVRGVRTLLARGHRTFVEIGPSASLALLARDASPIDDAVWLSSLEKGRSDWEQILGTMAALYVEGSKINWAGLDREGTRATISLPTYPFQRERHWIEGTSHALPPAAENRTNEREWIHAIEWREQELERAPGADVERWILVGEPSEAAAALAARIRSDGFEPVIVSPIGIEGVQRARLRETIDGRPDSGNPADVHVVDLAPLGVTGFGDPVLDAQRSVSGTLLEIAQACAGARARVSLSIVTCGATGPGGVVHAAQATAWGMAASLAYEHPDLNARCIDVDPSAAVDPRVLWQALRASADRIAIRAGRCHVARLTRATLPVEPAVLDGEAAYLVTGGFGGLGRHVVTALVERGARRIAVASRHASAEAATGMTDHRPGVTVTSFPADVSSWTEAERLVEAVEAALGPLRGVIHAAGVLDDGVLEQQSWERLERVLAPKVAGAVHLHHATLHCPLDFFVLFSSMAGVLGSAAQTSYGAANAFLDALAAARRQAGLPAVSVSWGPFAEEGMAAGVRSTHRQRWADAGVTPMQPARVMNLLPRIARAFQANVIVGSVDWNRYAARADWLAPFLGELVTVPQARAATIAGEWLQAPAHRRRALVLDFCTRTAADVLQVDSVAPDRSLSELGLDSLMAIELRNRIQHATGTTVPMSRLLEGATAEEIAALVVDTGQHGAPMPASPSSGSESVTPEEAEALLMKIDEMDEREVDALLVQLEQTRQVG